MRDPGSPGDLLDRHVVETPTGEKPKCLPLQPVTGLFTSIHVTMLVTNTPNRGADFSTADESDR